MIGRLATIVLALATGMPAMAQVHRLKDGAGGGDCARIGSWDAAARTCTLAGNTTGTVALLSDDLTLDGAGHTLKPAPGQAVALGALGPDRLTVRNLAIEGHHVGISLGAGSGHRVAGNRIARPRQAAAAQGGQAAIHIWDAADCRVEGNRIDDGDRGIMLERTQGCVVDGNRLAGMLIGIWAIPAERLTVSRNRLIGQARQGSGMLLAGGRAIVSENHAESWQIGLAIDRDTGDRVAFNLLVDNEVGIEHMLARDSDFYCNDLKGNGTGLVVSLLTFNTRHWWNNFLATDDADDRAGAALLDVGRPAGGNHWARDAAVCRDPDGDGFCNAPHVAGLSQDNLPHVRPIPWRLGPELCRPSGGGQRPPQQSPPSG
jgi:parallel beta-helix repeat protein